MYSELPAMSPERPAMSPERPAMSSGPFSVGLLGFGTVGSAFATLLEQRAAHIERLTGRLPVLGGALTTTEGSFPEILDSSDSIVELIGGIEPAREYVLAALGAGKHVVTANKQLLSQHGEELFCAARAGGAQLRSRQPWRVSCRSYACSRSPWPERTLSASTGSST